MVEEIGRAWMGITKMRVGPFGLLDFIGLQLVWNITDSRRFHHEQDD